MSIVNSTDIINWTQGPEILITHAGPATDFWYGWILTFSIWLIIVMFLFFGNERRWAVAAASFIGMISAAMGLVLTWNNESLIIVQLVLFVVGVAAGFVAP